MKKEFFLFSAAILLALNFFAWQEVFALAGPHYLKVDFLNVGQGDSEFIETPQGHQILIDGGPDSTLMGELAKYMPIWDKEIDLVILTHPEKDHMQGLLDALQKYKADYILWSGVKKNSARIQPVAESFGISKKIGSKNNNCRSWAGNKSWKCFG